MGRPKCELKKIHKKRVKKSKAKLKLYSKGELSFKNLTEHAKHFLKKQKKAAN